MRRRRQEGAGRGDEGQASVEAVALLPLLAVLALAAWQAVRVGQASWLAAGAARAAARAQAVGADPAAAARRALPVALERGLRVEPAARPGAVTVRVAVPSVLGGTPLATASASAAFPEQRR